MKIVVQKPIKVAVIGVGAIGSQHARVYSEIPEVQLVAVCDIREATGKIIASKFNCKYYKDYKKLLSNEIIDAVSIAVPINLHKIVALEALKAEKHILLEKPIASNLKEAKTIIDEARKQRKIFTIGHVERFNPAVIELKKIIKRGRLGEILSVLIQRVGFFPRSKPRVNIIIDLAVHDIDILNFLLQQKLSSIYAIGGSVFGYADIEKAEILLKYGKIDSFIHVNWVTPVKIRKVFLTGMKGYIELNYLTQELTFYEGTYGEKVFKNFHEFIEKFSQPKTIKIKVKKQEPLKNELSYFVNAIRTKSQPQVTGEDALLALSIAEKVVKFIKSKHD